MKKVSAFVLGVGVVAACAAAETIWVGEAESLQDVLLDSGDVLEVRLESNATTGYEWVIDEKSTPGALRLLDSRFEEPETELVGAPGTQVFRLEAVEKGAGVLRIEYIRPFDDPPIPDTVVEYIVIVDGARWPPEEGAPPGTSTETAP